MLWLPRNPCETPVRKGTHVTRAPHVLLSSLLLATGLLSSLAAQAARITVTDAATGKPLPEAVVEVDIEGASKAAPSSVDVYQRNAAFHPHVSAVSVGSSVSFPNRDTTRHHVYSFSPTGVFDLNLYRQETPPPVPFDTAGVAVLGCNIHDHMQAFIVVSDAAKFAITDENGQVNLEDLASTDCGYGTLALKKPISSGGRHPGRSAPATCAASPYRFRSQRNQRLSSLRCNSASIGP